ncbi:flagellar hook-length control protein FliK [Idiomarina piscisalsi]|uniref:Flagellar hook-length control protein n=1 Tax=Idiomarina piscisalsi TaxID=1096243 RepID=A0A432YF69_9GAMM|nr:flagellar hook-length control protein FliK [Idiomarina piscisalsi]RUO59608.1 flagellar hook-length control protein [Idiomarina piscisalsi]
MQQLLNLTESTENFVRTGGKAGGKALGKELSLGAGESSDGEFSRLMMQQTEKGKEFQQVKLMPEQATIKKDIDGEGRRNVGAPVESNLFELLQEMQQQMAEVSSEEGEAELSADEVAAVVNIDETQLEKTGDIELSDADLEELLAVFVDKLSHQQGDQKELSAEQRQSLAESMLAKMTDEQKQQLMEQLNAIAKGGADAADQKFIVQLLEPVMPKSDADKLLVGKDKALSENIAAGKDTNKQSDARQVSHALLAALRDVVTESKQESQKSSDPAQLMKQLEAQLAALKENGNTDAKALTGKERGKLEQLMAELRQLMAGASDNKESLTKEQATKAEQLIADLRQTLKQSSDKASAVGASTDTKSGKAEFAISATDSNKGPGESRAEQLAKADKNTKAELAADGQVKGDKALKPDGELATKTAENAQVNQAFRNTVDALSDAGAAKAIQGQMVSTAQGTVAASESSQANTLQALQRPLDLQQTEASQKLQERINIMMSKNIQRADIRLDPPELGNVQIRVNVSGEQTTVQFQVQNAQAREAIESAMPRLREMMEQQGLNLADTQVGEQARDGSGTGDGENASGSETEHWTQESEIALQDGQVVTDGRVDFYV